MLTEHTGNWGLAPAFGVVWAYNSKGTWTNRHQMSVNGKRDSFTRSDLMAVANLHHIKNAEEVIDSVIGEVAAWKSTAKDCGVASDLIKTSAGIQRLNLQGE